MMSKKKIIITLVLTIVLSIIIPISFRDQSETLNQTLDIIATLTSSISGILTLIIAIILFNKFGIETPLLGKSTEVVFAFLEELKKTVFFIDGKSFGIFIRPHDPLHERFEEWYGENLIFSTEYMLGLSNLLEIADSPFMPKSIYVKADKLRFSVLVMDIKGEDLDKYARVHVSGQALNASNFGRFNHQDMTLFEFLNIVNDLNNEIKNWIGKHSTYSPDLNI